MAKRNGFSLPTYSNETILTVYLTLSCTSTIGQENHAAQLSSKDLGSHRVISVHRHLASTNFVAAGIDAEHLGRPVLQTDDGAAANLFV